MLIGALSTIYLTIEEKDDYAKAIEMLNAMKINSLVNYYINVAEEYDEQDSVIIQQIIWILQAIYNNSGEISPVTDEDYDKIYEINRTFTGEEIVGSFNASDRNISNHKYPDLRGTLDKVHFITLEDKGKDKRKSIPEWRKAVENKLGRPLTDDECQMYAFPKFDGLSEIFECDNTGLVEKVLSRGDTDKNEAVDTTKLFKGTKFSMIEGWNSPYGIKTEVVMSEDNYNELCSKEGDFKSPRSAVSSILNSKELDRKYLKYLTVVPLQIQNYDTKQIIVAPSMFQQYPWSLINLNDEDHMRETFNGIKKKMETEYGVPIDGIVLRFKNTNLHTVLGRDGAINKYEVAFKFPPEQKKTILKDIDFSVGILGGVTPVAKIEPVKIKGNTIKSISLGSIDRFESFEFRVGDEVIVKYDIIPYLTKDETCKPGIGKKFETPKECPFCHEELKKDPVLKCVNLNCESRAIGKILNYVEKMRIANISIGIITTLFKAGYLKSIEDLYKLEKHKRSIVMMDGFGETSFNKIIAGVDSRRDVYDYEFMGSLGIPDIGRKMFKKISNIYYLDELIQICINDKAEKLTAIGGIKKKTANKIIEGVNLNKDLITFLRSELKIRRDERRYTIKVYFTKVRDKEFAKYLESKDVLIMESYNNEVDLLIIPDRNTESSKITKAQKANKEIVTIDEAYKMFGYNQ